MRTEMKFQGKEILAIWIKGCVPYLSDVYNTKFTNAIKQSKMEKTEKKEIFDS